ncbi:SDR family NAD(P)-dependent oxidoreductase [Natronomonas sp. CBA1123]|jgi:NAD(P)-dependent dehydrogenase (short-subunit alcohol dehydrogenase family)|uniref:oxidoreductase n=1 Tax=Natronomonas sp. CBA1123 TaxID=2668070 RepID=UPI0012EA2AA2|nr:oxidoreductase [Natronomonas sp. CBA1123]MUV86822.1 SDR family NAD(P)-dependent oxidoreductase [Natronomonas sp. CBA1123]
MSNWTREDMPELSGRTVVVTGANSGLGLEATRAFARKGAHVVMACRNVESAEDAREEIREEVPGASLTVEALDLADLDSVRAFAETAIDLGRIDVLCNNAGVMAIPRSETADGFETQFGVNHLGHFALTGLLLDSLRAAPDPRVVTQSSGIHTNGRIDFEDLHGTDDYDKWGAYAQSKLANLLFAYELDRRYDELTSVGCHPGYAATNLQRRGPEQEGSRLKLAAMAVANRIFAQSAEAGALPMLYAATAEDVEGGDYVGPGGLMNMRGAPETQRSSKRSYDEDTAERLWSVSEELTGVSYD